MLAGMLTSLLLTHLAGGLRLLEGSWRKAHCCKDEVGRHDNEQSIVELFNRSPLSATLLRESGCFTNPECWSGSVGDN